MFEQLMTELRLNYKLVSTASSVPVHLLSCSTCSKCHAISMRVRSKALVGGPASVARSATGDARRVARRAAAGEKIVTCMREYMPENQVTTCVYTPPEPRRGVYQDALGCLGEETSCFILFMIRVLSSRFKRCLTKRNRRRRRIAKQNLVNANGEECKQAPIIVLCSLRRIPKRAITANTEKHLLFFFGYGV